MDRGWSSNRLAAWVAAIHQDDRAPTKGLGSLAGRLGTADDKRVNIQNMSQGHGFQWLSIFHHIAYSL